MARGDHMSRVRIWTNDSGETMRSRGKYSEAEKRAIQKAGGIVKFEDGTSIESKVKAHEVKEEVKVAAPIKQPVIIKKTAQQDPKKFIEAAEEANKFLKIAMQNSENSHEETLLRGFIAIINNQMLPKYRDQLKTII